MDLMKIRSGLDEFDLDHLKRMYALLFDMWCWEDNNENLKEVLDTIDSRIAELDLGSSVGPLNKPLLNVTDDHRVCLTAPMNQCEWELFQINGGGYGCPEITGELKLMITELVNKEMFNTYGGCSTLSTEFQNAIINATFGMQQEITDLTDKVAKLELAEMLRGA